MKQNTAKSGFTLVELIMVIAILAIIASIGITKIGDLRASSAKRVNIYNLQQLTRAASIYVTAKDTTTGIFDKMESLVDVSESGKWTGTPGTYDWNKTDLTSYPGVYRGPKRVSDIKDAGGGGADTTNQTLDQQRKNNQGLTDSFINKVGIYYISTNDVTKFKNAGISNYLLHNYVAGQASLFGFTQNEDGTPLENGGPGFRADMSAFYKVSLVPGSPVVVLNPIAAAGIYRALGCDLNLTAEEARFTNTAQAVEKANTLIAASRMSYRLFCFGLGRTSVFARNGLDSVPRSEIVGKDYYRNYIMVFKQPTSGPSGQPVSFAGFLDPNGNTAEDARFNTDWY